jgi:ubiquitin-protein ligase
VPQVDVHTTPTDNLDCFEDVLDNMTTGGSTGIYKAIAKACDLLAVEGKAYPDADLRVVVLTDGQNNQNDVTLNEAVTRLGEVGAICDALLVGDRCDPGLRQLVAATEGDCFQIDGLAGAYETLESPAVISLEARRNGAPKPTREEFRRRVAKVNVQTVKGACVQRGAKILAPPPMASTVKTWTTTSVFAASIPRGVAQKRLVKDVNIIAGSAKLANKVVCFPGLDEAGNMISLKALVLPKKGPYAGRVIEINLTGLDSGFPFQAPRVNVASPLYHYAVSTQGGVCLEMLQYAWSPKTTLEEVLDSLYKLIVEHESFDPTCNLSIRNWLSELLRVDAAKYYAEATAKAKAETQVVPVADVETSLFHQYAIVKP